MEDQSPTDETRIERLLSDRRWEELGRPVPVGPAKLLVQLEPDGKPFEHEIVDDVTTIGRGPENIIVLTDTDSSRRHCEIRLEAFRGSRDYRLHDLGSSNGTLVNNNRVTRQTLRPGDVISVGAATLVFQQKVRGSGSRRTRRRSSTRDYAIGGALVANGAISNEQLEHALEVQACEGGLLGQILRRDGTCSEDDVTAGLQEQQRFTQIERLRQLDIPAAVTSLVPRGLCEEHHLIPFELLAGRLLCVAMVNVLNRKAVTALKVRTGMEMKCFKAPWSDIQQAIERWYAGQDDALAEPAEPASDERTGGNPAAGRPSSTRRETAAPAEASPGHAVFISYRREGGAETARLVRSALAAKGVRAFLDVEDLGASHFDEKLLREIDDAPNFVVILTPGSLDRCRDEGDWLRFELAHAIASGRNVVPLLKDGFAFPPPSDLPDAIRDLPRHNGVKYSHEYFGAAMDRLLTLLKLPDGR